MRNIPEPPAWLDFALSLICYVAATVLFLSDLLGLEIDRATALALVACGVSFDNSYELRKRV